jgi:hypothetical protein
MLINLNDTDNIEHDYYGENHQTTVNNETKQLELEKYICDPTHSK